MQQQVKLVVAQTLEGDKLQFYIFKSQQVGKGGFGSVYKAVDASNKTTQLACKIVPYNGDQVKKQKIQKEINILKKLPQHPNLVKVLPIKCFSDNNFYIFMEYCNEGTLIDAIKSGGLMKEQQIFSIFYQLMSGYKALWQNGILHQDMKPENVLIKNNKLKITDFGFSILTQKYVPSLTRQGTVHYMPIEKLTDPKYIATELSDIYSIGIIMHYLITKRHPYINEKKLTHGQFVKKLKNAQIESPPQHVKLYSSFSFKTLFDILYQMIAKKESKRICCKDVYRYMENQKIYEQFQDKNMEMSEVFHVDIRQYTITSETKAFAISFQSDEKEEKQILEQLSQEAKLKAEQQNKQIFQKIEHFVFSHRIVVYFVDRLARRLYIEKQKSSFLNKKQHEYNKIILCFLLLEAKLTKTILKQTRFPKLFSQQQLKVFKKLDSHHLIKLISKDDENIQDAINENLKKTNQIKIQQQKKLIDKSEKDSLEQFCRHLADIILIQFLKTKASIIKGRHDLITLCYLIDGVDILRNPQQYLEKEGLELEGYFRKIQSQDIITMIKKVEEYFMKENIQFCYEEDEEEESELMKIKYIE